MLLNLNLNVNDIDKALEISDKEISIKASTSAKLSYGKYFDVLVEKPCKVEKL